MAPASSQTMAPKPAAAEPYAAKAEATKAVPASWAYQPVSRPAPPAVKARAWVRTPVDAFVLARLEQAGLKPSAEADRATLIRRLTLDLHGLVPTPEEVQAFVADRSPQAYDKLVDRLLASPRYGERFGRRWLDLARYADTQGFSDDEYRPGMWRYREYVIRSYNEDKPFDRFVREQVAGDELWPQSQDAIVATGFLRGYPDAPDHRDLLQKRYQAITEMTDIVGTVILGHTLECARCHTHKADKVTQKEYFQMQAFFGNTVPSDSLAVLQKGAREFKFEKDYAAWEDVTKDVRARIDAFIAPHRDAILKYAKERFYEDGRAALFKPRDQWTPLDRWLNVRFDEYVVKNNNNYKYEIGFYGQANAFFNETLERAEFEPGVAKATIAAYKERQQKFSALLREFRASYDKRPAQGATVLSALTELGFTDAAPTHVYMGGNHERPLEEVQPGFPALFSPPGATTPQIWPTGHSSGRRVALAEWLTRGDHPLTARVYVNRVWAGLFDQGIVATLSDFGRAGQRPTHPELLDHLAGRFIEQGWSTKKLVREIVLSSVYRQASDERPEVAKADPQNRLLALFPRKRLESEQLRDSLLAAAGLLVHRDGGPGVYPPIPEAVMKQSTRRIPAFWPVSKDVSEHHTRSVYVYVRRSVPYPMFDNFDGANNHNPHSRRDATTTPQQSLTLFNNELVYGWSKALAGRVIREAGADEQAQVERLFQLLFGRAPSRADRQLAQRFLDGQEAVIRAQATGGKLAVAVPVGLSALPPKTDATRLAAFVDLTHTLANSNEFIYRY
ncbi:MAG: DUF1553 domain-containing protein [Rubrivivax sp.]|nr:DUF1553 domain-containing protein [Rubrivivax sp.]